MNPKLASFSEVERLIADGAEETHNLEFKRKTSPTDVDLGKEDRRLFGEALSGFANATGGVLVIGIGTEKHHGIDRAASLHKLANAEAVAARYRSYASECLSPPMENLTVRAITDSAGSGVVVIDVPRGPARPHMSTAPGHHTYYRRVMDSFVPMQHYEVEEMMRIKVSPILNLILDFQGGGSLGGNRKTYLRFGLRNDSNTTAKYPYITLRPSLVGPRLADFGLDGNGNTLWKKMLGGMPGETTFAAGADMVLHPKQAVYVSRFEYLHSLDQRIDRYWVAESLSQSESVRMEFAYGCEDVPAISRTVELSKSHFMNAELPEEFSRT